MVNRSKLSLLERTRPRTVAATRDRGIDGEAVMYLVSVAIALTAMFMAAMAGS
jgi:hypothetical protein